MTSELTSSEYFELIGELIPELTSLQCYWKENQKGKSTDKTPLCGVPHLQKHNLRDGDFLLYCPEYKLYNPRMILDCRRSKLVFPGQTSHKSICCQRIFLKRQLLCFRLKFLRFAFVVKKKEVFSLLISVLTVGGKSSEQNSGGSPLINLIDRVSSGSHAAAYLSS